MSTVTLRPATATTTPSGWGVGSPAGPTLATVIGDGLDSTWAVDNVAVSTTRHLNAFMPPYVLPVNAVVKSARPVIRVSQSAGDVARLGIVGGVYTLLPAVQSKRTVIVPTSTLKNFTCAAIPGPLTQAQLNKLFVRIDTDGSIIGLTHRVHDMWLELDVSFAPSATALGLSPSDAFNRTSAPAVVWTYSSPQNAEQVGYRVAFWKTADISDANWVAPDVSFVPAAGGAVKTPVLLYTGSGAAEVYQPPSSLGLINGTAYTVYVRVADAPLGGRRYGAWASYAFTQAVLAPPTPAAGDLSATWDATHWRTAITYQSRLNLLSTDDASIEGTIGSWAMQQGTGTLVRSTTQFLSGVASLQLTMTGTGNTSIRTASGILGRPVTPGQTYTGLASSRAATTTRTWQAFLFWYDAAGTFLSSNSGTGVTNATGTWTAFSAQAVAPANSAYAALVLFSATAANGEIHRFDQMGIFPGTGAVPSWTRGGLSSSAALYVERSGNAGVTWVPIPITAAISTAGAAMTTYDTANPPNQAVTYRVTTVSVDELGYLVSSSPSAALGPVTGIFSTHVLRDPLDPLGEVAIKPQGDWIPVRPERQGEFWALGAPYSIVVSDIVGSQRVPARLLVRGRPEYNTLLALRRRMTTLLLQFDTTEAWWCHLGPSETLEHVRAASRKNPTSGSAANFFLETEIIETVAPLDLPQELL